LPAKESVYPLLHANSGSILLMKSVGKHPREAGRAGKEETVGLAPTARKKFWEGKLS
jgi:hypothetical protein